MRNSPQLPVIHHTAEDIYRETEETEREKKKRPQEEVTLH